MPTHILLRTYITIIAVIAGLWALGPATCAAQTPCSESNLLTDARISASHEVYEPALLNDQILDVDNAAWNSERTAIFQSRRSYVVFDLGMPREVASFVLQGDNNDLFHLEGSLDGSSWDHLWSAPRVQTPGLQTREGSISATPIRYMRVTTDGGDDFVSIGEVVAFCKRPEQWRSTVSMIPSSPRIPPVEFRQGAGATFWLWLWSGVLAALTGICAVSNLRRQSLSSGTWLTTLSRHLQETYFTLDRRTLGLFRIALGFLLFFDLYYWAQSFNLLLSSDGLLAPRALLLGKNPFSSFTVLRWSSSDVTTWTFILVSLLSYTAFLVGYRTRVAHILAWICAISLHNAVQLLNNSGHMVMRLLLTWTLLLPLGERFSLDASRRSSRGELLPPAKFTSIFAIILLLQLSAIYFFNVLHKFDDSWLDGSFLSLILQDPGITTGIGQRIREWTPAWILTGGTALTLAVEAAGPFLLLSPVAHRACRTLAVSALVILHLVIALCMKLAIFSGAMICFLIAMLPGDIAERIVRSALRVFGRDLTTREAQHTEIDETRYSWGIRRRAILTTVFVAVFGAASISQLIRENEPLSLWFPHAPNPSLQRVLTALNTYQGWCMFATCGNRSYPATFETLVIEATDARGERIDLLRSIFAGRAIAPPPDLISPLLELHNEQWRQYNRRLLERNPAILAGLANYLRTFPHAQFNTTPPIRLEAYVRYQPLFAPYTAYPPLIIRRDAPDLGTLITP